jgi:hypothetical protein
MIPDAGPVAEFCFFPGGDHLPDAVPAGEENRPVTDKRTVFATGSGKGVDNGEFPVFDGLLFLSPGIGFFTHPGFQVARRIPNVRYKITSICLFREVTRHPTVFEKTDNILTGNFFALPFLDTDAGSMLKSLFLLITHLSGFSSISGREAYCHLPG